MRYMLLHKTNDNLEAGDPPDRRCWRGRTLCSRRCVRPGVLLLGEGLMPSSRGARITFPAPGEPRVLDGPFAETKELVAGVSIIRVESKEEAVQWALRFAEADPNTPIDILEIAG